MPSSTTARNPRCHNRSANGHAESGDRVRAVRDCSLVTHEKLHSAAAATAVVVIIVIVD